MNQIAFALYLITADEEKTVDWVDFKKAYPKLENNPAIKKLFGGRRKIPISEVKERLPQILKETQKKGSDFDAFDDIEWTYDSWAGGQRSFGVVDIVLVMNMGQRMVAELKEKLPGVYNYMVSNSVGGHPGGKHSIGWVRIAPLKGQAAVEEMQSDQLDRLWSKEGSDLEEVHNYFFKLVDWTGTMSKRAFKIAKNLAAKSAGDSDSAGEVFWVGPETVARDHHVRSERKLNMYYKTIPRKLGMHGPANYSLKNGMLVLDPSGKLDCWSETEVAKEEAVEEKKIKLSDELTDKHAKYYALLGAGGRRVNWADVDKVWEEVTGKGKKPPEALINEYKQLLRTYADGVYESQVKEK